MNAPPEANSEYSRGSRPFGRPARARRPGAPDPGSPRPQAAESARTALALGALLGTLLVLVAQFTALYHLHSATSSVAIRTVGTGANHAWAPIPLALVSLALIYAVYRLGSRAPLIGLAALGIATLAIALLGDLPAARASGLIGSSASGYVQATSIPSAGLYMETLGAIVLLVAGGLGVLLLAPSDGSPAEAPAPRRAAPTRPVLVLEPARTKLDLQTREPEH